jgi:dipeptidyl aminopeptidase/acylaminoacyl peptidase
MSALGRLGHASSNIEAYLGAGREQRRLSAPQASPLLYVDGDDPPVLFIHGTADPLVPLAQSQKMQRALTDAGVAARLIAVEGGGHGIELGTSKQQLPELVEAMIDWFDAQLGRGASGSA